MRKLICTVRLGKDAETAKDKNGQEFIKFTAASQEYNEENPMWLNCISYAPSVLRLAQYMTKGHSFILTGEYSERTYMLNNEQQVSKDLVVQSADFVPGGSKKDDEQGNGQSTSTPRSNGKSQARNLDDEPKAQVRQQQAPIEDDGDDLPF